MSSQMKKGQGVTVISPSPPPPREKKFKKMESKNKGKKVHKNYCKFKKSSNPA